MAYATATVLGVAALMALAGGLVAGRQSVLGRRLVGAERQRSLGALARGSGSRRGRCPRDDPARWRLLWASEVVFAVAFFAMALLVAYSPDVWGTEKPMDMAFMNAANASPRSRRTTRGWRGRTSTTTTSATSRWRW